MGGYTLLEILVVLSIIGIILAISVPQLVKAREVTNELSARASLQSVTAALELYFAKSHGYPDHLSDLVSEGYLAAKGILDPWGHEYVYKPVYEGKSNSRFELFSSGKDGVPGTPDDVHPEQ